MTHADRRSRNRGFRRPLPPPFTAPRFALERRTRGLVTRNTAVVVVDTTLLYSIVRTYKWRRKEEEEAR
jgi:hypothetical protein